MWPTDTLEISLSRHQTSDACHLLFIFLVKPSREGQLSKGTAEPAAQGRCQSQPDLPVPYCQKAGEAPLLWVCPPVDLQLNAGETIGQLGAGGDSWVPSRLAEKGWNFGVAILTLPNGETPSPVPAACQECAILPRRERGCQARVKTCFSKENLSVAERL